MIDVATLSVIRRWALREQLPIREIARRTGENGDRRVDIYVHG